MKTKADPTIWQCPSCQSDLIEIQHQFICENNHSFDKAKEGYVNLLLAHHKKSKIPGDSKEMVNARHDFLQQGHYAPLASKISTLLQTHLYQDSSIDIFDAGCGEAYYLREVFQQLHTFYDSKDNKPLLSGSGIDISKFAIQKAAKQNRSQSINSLHLSVASTYKLPVASESKNAVIQVFAPSDVNEIERVLKPGGVYIRVNPAKDHLFDMKSFVYDRAQKHEQDKTDLRQFSLIEETSLSFKIALSNEQERVNLLMMTPFYWTISADKKAKLQQELKTTLVDFDIKVLRKN